MNDIKKTENSAILSINNIWSDPKIKAVIKQSYASDLTNEEFTLFVGLGMSLQANPFKGELFSTVYNKSDQKNRKVSYFCSRDFDRRKAQEQQDYNGHRVEAVYSEDDFECKDGAINHTWKFGDRGKLIGAYGIGWRKGISNPFMVNVLASEYNKGQSTWKTIPETMLKKVAEAQLLRQMYSGILQGVYSIDEKPYIDFTHGLSSGKYKSTPDLSPEGGLNGSSGDQTKDQLKDTGKKKSSDTVDSDSIPEKDIDTEEIKNPTETKKEKVPPTAAQCERFINALIEKVGSPAVAYNNLAECLDGVIKSPNDFVSVPQMFKYAHKLGIGDFLDKEKGE